MLSHRGSSPSASTTLTRSGTHRLERSVFGKVFSRPLANAPDGEDAGHQVNVAQSTPKTSSRRTPVPTQTIASGQNGPRQELRQAHLGPPYQP
jgi:hypothetical protein